MLLETGGTDGIEHTESAETVDITGVLGELERDLDVGLGAEVVDLGGLDLRDDVDEVGSVGQVTVVKDHLGCQQLRKGLAGQVEWRKRIGRRRSRTVQGRRGCTVVWGSCRVDRVI